MSSTEVRSVYVAICAVQAELAAIGISKDRRNQQQGFSFRGIDDVLNALSPILAKHQLCILPRVISREMTERVNAKGTALFYVTLIVEYDIVSARDGSVHTVRAVGEAMDSGDKATNKAMSAAYKYAAIQTFCIPTEGDNDSDATTHDVRGRNAPPPRDDLPEGPPSEHAKWVAGMVASMREAALAKDRALCEGLRDQAKARCTAIADVEGYQAILNAMKHPEGAAA